MKDDDISSGRNGHRGLDLSVIECILSDEIHDISWVDIGICPIVFENNFPPGATVVILDFQDLGGILLYAPMGDEASVPFLIEKHFASQ